MDENMTIADLLAKRNVIDVKELWYDWFCSDKALVNRGKSLLTKLNGIADSKKFDKHKCYVFFKNNCPAAGRLFDDFRICARRILVLPARHIGHSDTLVTV